MATKEVPSTIAEMIQEVDSCLAIQLATRSSRSFLPRNSKDYSLSPIHPRMKPRGPRNPEPSFRCPTTA